MIRFWEFSEISVNFRWNAFIFCGSSDLVGLSLMLLLFVFFDASLYIFTKIRTARGWLLMLLKKVSLLKVSELIFKDAVT